MSGSSERLGNRARGILEDGANDIYFSVVSAWEVVIKARVGKLAVVGEPDDYVRSRLRMQRLRILPCELEHVVGVANLPDHHRDPFDRLLVAQAISEDFTLLSSDERLRSYAVQWVDARA